MSATYINLDPIAQSIRAFGSGLANNALKKAQLDRQYANDQLAFEKAQVDMDYTKARNQREAEKHAEWMKLPQGYDPSLLTPQQRNMIAINAMAGHNVSSDAIKAAERIINPGGVKEQYEPLNMAAIERFFPKKDADGQVVIDPLTGRPVVDSDAISKAALALKAMNIAPTTGAMQHYGMGLITPPAAPAQVAPQPVATNLPTQGANQPTVNPIEIEQQKNVIRQLLRSKKISLQDAIAMANSLGISN